MTFRAIPEWAPHKAMWTAWPSNPKEWPDGFDAVREEVAGMIKALAHDEVVKVLAMGEEGLESARRMIDWKNVDIIPARFWDIWMRDMGAIFVGGDDGLVVHMFRFNAYGDKFNLLDNADDIGALMARSSGPCMMRHDFFLEGGSVDFDGEGRVLTTKQCLLNPNRNPNLTQEDIEDRLCRLFGVHAIFWLDEGLKADHTDGHIDNLARFVGPGRVVCHKASGTDDPNAANYDRVAVYLKKLGLEVIRVPSPGLVLGTNGRPVAASHMNFIIGNGTVVIPKYEDVYSKEAVAVLKSVFPDRDVVALPSKHILGCENVGGGSFHCITQQEPAI